MQTNIKKKRDVVIHCFTFLHKMGDENAKYKPKSRCHIKQLCLQARIRD